MDKGLVNDGAVVGRDARRMKRRRRTKKKKKKKREGAKGKGNEH